MKCSSAVPPQAAIVASEFSRLEELYRKLCGDRAELWINGQPLVVSSGPTLDPEETLLEALRRLGLTSCKLGCGEGGCGACTVSVTTVDHRHNVRRFAINACLTPLLSLDGTHIMTAEGLCKPRELLLHPVQRLMADSYASQCGFCTPGIVMSLYSKLTSSVHESEKQIVFDEEQDSTRPTTRSSLASSERSSDEATENLSADDICAWLPQLQDMEEAVDGNLCRCTGYRPIMYTMRQLAYLGHTVRSAWDTTKLNTAPPNGTPQDISTTLPPARKLPIPIRSRKPRNTKPKPWLEYEDLPQQPKAFSLEPSTLRPTTLLTYQMRQSLQWMVQLERQQRHGVLKLLQPPGSRPLLVSGIRFGRPCSWFSPNKLYDLLCIVTHHFLTNAAFKILVGNSERHIERCFKQTHSYPLNLISLHKVEELQRIRWTGSSVIIGAAVPLTEVARSFRRRLEEIEQQPQSAANDGRHVLRAYVAQLRSFAGCQVRNVATLGGNIVTASPISDLNPLHVAAGAQLHIARLAEGSLAATDKPVLAVEQSVKSIDGFFVGYRRVALGPAEILTAVEIPLAAEAGLGRQIVFGFKVGRRKEDDIAIVNAGMSVELRGDIYKEPRQPVVERLVVALGGMAPTVIRLSEVEAFWRNRPWTFQSFLEGLPVLAATTALPANVPGGLAHFRSLLARTFFVKFFAQTLFEAQTVFGRQDIDPAAGNPKPDPLDWGAAPAGYLAQAAPHLRGFLAAVWPPRLRLDAFAPPPHSTYNYSHRQCQGSQYFELAPRARNSSVGSPVPHAATELHTAGTATYVDDLPPAPNELQASPVLSTHACAVVVSLDASRCHNLDDFVGLVTADDVKGELFVGGGALADEPLFALQEVHCVGQLIALAVARSRAAAREAASRVKIQYDDNKDTQAGITSIDEAIRRRNFFVLNNATKADYLMLRALGRKQRPRAVIPLSRPTSMERLWREELQLEAGDAPCPGDVNPLPFWLDWTAAPPAEAAENTTQDQVPLVRDATASLQPRAARSRCGRFVGVSGGVRIGGQEHFYLEPQGCIATPGERPDEMTIVSSTQDLSKTQTMVARVTGFSSHKIVCRCKRIGGGFGGKETRASLVAAAAAVAAQKFGAPVRLVLDRDNDIRVSGQRHGFVCFYRAAAEVESLLLSAVDLQLFSDGGWSTDLSVPVLERALLHCENSYYVPNFRATGRICRTNLPSNTAFRGFGGPQGMFLAETYIEHLAAALCVRPEQLRYANLYLPGDLTPYGTVLRDLRLPRMWRQLTVSSDFRRRAVAANRFNRRERWRRRGLGIVPVKFGMSFTKAFMNQAGALVHIYTDGTVLVAHSGIEMGQGLHTKIAQVAADSLDIPIRCVNIAANATDLVPNVPPTAASVGSDLNGLATLDACSKLNKRLKPFLAAASAATSGESLRSDDARAERFRKAAAAAHMQRISLSATGFYATPNSGMVAWSNGDIACNPFHYFSCGVACSEVTVDCLSGEHSVERVDIVFDLGLSLNPALDIGQIEGAFVQGQGLFTLEEIVVQPNGSFFTLGPGAYKIPAFGDVSRRFNVTLLGNSTNPAIPSLYSSKGVGEPPLFLASSVFFAIRAAVESKQLTVVADSFGGSLQPVALPWRHAWSLLRGGGRRKARIDCYYAADADAARAPDVLRGPCHQTPQEPRGGPSEGEPFLAAAQLFVAVALSDFSSTETKCSDEPPPPPMETARSDGEPDVLVRRIFSPFHSPATTAVIGRACLPSL